jgi:hypothetical protein
MTSPQPPRSIDLSLARSIRRGYFRRLAREWAAYDQRRGRAAGRNVSLSAWMDTRRQFRERLGLLEKFAGPLLPACTLRIESGTRAAAVVWALKPEDVPTAVNVDSHACIRALVLLQPGRLLPLEVAVRIRAHAVDRVVQRAQVVDLPIRDMDMQAVNAEFADLMPLACVAARILTEKVNGRDVGAETAEPAEAAGAAEAAETARSLNVLLPAQHGVFLGGWCSDSQQLEIRTFVDHAKLNAAQQEAVREIQRIAQDQVCTQALQALVPGWMGSADEGGLRDRLLQAWQHFGWRFEEDRLHPGLSDRAWREHDVSGRTQGPAVGPSGAHGLSLPSN